MVSCNIFYPAGFTPTGFFMYMVMRVVDKYDSKGMSQQRYNTFSRYANKFLI